MLTAIEGKQIEFLRCLKIYTNKTVAYSKILNADWSDRVLPEKHYSNPVLSAVSKRKIEKIIDFMADVSKWKKIWCYEDKKFHWFRLGFLTLTLPVMQLTKKGYWLNLHNNSGVLVEPFEDLEDTHFNYTDETLKSFILNHFLTVLREKYKVNNYLWKAETQANGNIHFHIVIDQFIHFKALNYIWNRCLSKTDMINKFENKHGHGNPPTTEIHSVRKVKSIRKYLTKYLSKSEEGRRHISGRRWACNYELSNYDGITVELTGGKLIDEEKLFNIPETYKWKKDYVTIYNLSIGELAYVLEGSYIITEYVEEFRYKYKFDITLN